MQRILVPCDFSEQAISAFRFAIDLARESQREVHALHVIEMPVMNDNMLMPTLSFEASMMDELSSSAKERFAELVAGVGPNPAVTTKVVFGHISLMILDYVKELDIDLIVMGTKGVSGLRELLVGSTAEKIVRHAPCPVITVRKDCEFHNVKNIVFPNSLEVDQADLVDHVKNLQNFFKATLHVVWINTPNNFTSDTLNRLRLKDFARRFDLKNHTLNVFNDMTEESGVINFAHTVHADLITMGTHGRKGLNHLMSGSLTEDVVNHVDCPIWTYTIKHNN